MPEGAGKTGPSLIIRCGEPDNAQRLALLAQEELAARVVELDLRNRRDTGLGPLEARLELRIEGNLPEPLILDLDLASQTPEQCLMALLELLEQAGMGDEREGYSDQEEEQVNRRLEELGYL